MPCSHPPLFPPSLPLIELQVKLKYGGPREESHCERGHRGRHEDEARDLIGRKEGEADGGREEAHVDGVHSQEGGDAGKTSVTGGNVTSCGGLWHMSHK
jgi:hypothetical protein